MKYTLGVDIGTYQSKGVLVDETGAIAAQAVRDHRMIVPQPGWAEHRPEEDWWGDFVHVTREVLAASGVSPGDIAAVACSAIGPCMSPVDADGAPLMNGVLYGVDTRAAQEIDDLTREFGAEAIHERFGNALTSQSVGPKVLWLRRNHPELWEKTAKILTSTSFIVHRLTGEYVIDHYTAGSFAPLYDVGTQNWAADMRDAVCPVEMLPRLMWSSEIAGSVTAEASRQTGLAEGTPVTCGTIDAAAEAVSVGVRHTGDMMMMYGSSMFFIQVTDERVRDARLDYAPWLSPGTHAAMAGMVTGGTVTHWFRDQFARELDKETAFPVLTEEAQVSPPGARGLLMLPYFSGERTPIHDPKAKGAFFGLNVTHSRGDMYRALCEGIACGTAHVTETFADAGAAPARILAVGGGTNNAIWLQATSDISGIRQTLCEKIIGASYGDAFMAACTLGMAEPEDIDRWNPVAREVEPVESVDYAQQFALFKWLYQQTKDLAHALS